MPKATKRHTDKKNYQAHEAWKQRKRNANQVDTFKQLEQKYWRIDCLNARIEKGTITTKNEAESPRLVPEMNRT